MKSINSSIALLLVAATAAANAIDVLGVSLQGLYFFMIY